MFAFVAAELHLELMKLMKFKFLRSWITLCSEIRIVEVELHEKRIMKRVICSESIRVAGLVLNKS